MLWPIDKARLRARREAMGWTLQDLANRAGQSVRTLQDLESPKGRTSARPVTHHCLTKALGDPDGSLRLHARLGRLPREAAAPSPRRRGEPGASVPEAPAKRANVRITFTPPLSPLEMLVEEERGTGVLGTRVGDLPLLTAKLLWDIQTLFGVWDGTRVVVRGTVITQQALTAAELDALGAAPGTSARFVIARDVVPGVPLRVTVHVVDGARAFELQRAMVARSPIDVEAMVTTAPGGESVFDLWSGDEPEAWTLVATGEVTAAKGSAELRLDAPGSKVKKAGKGQRRRRS